MNDHSPARSIVDVSARLEHYLVPVPSGEENVCAVCHSAVYDGYRTCYRCNEARRTLSSYVSTPSALSVSLPRGNSWREISSRTSVPTSRNDNVVSVSDHILAVINSQPISVSRAAGSAVKCAVRSTALRSVFTCGSPIERRLSTEVTRYTSRSRPPEYPGTVPLWIA